MQAALAGAGNSCWLIVRFAGAAEFPTAKAGSGEVAVAAEADPLTVRADELDFVPVVADAG
jgi:hypothetical protein